MNKSLLLTLMFSGIMNMNAETINISHFRYMGPYPVQMPYQIDSVGVNSEKFDLAAFLDMPLPDSKTLYANSSVVEASGLPVIEKGMAVNIAGFSVENTSYTEATLKIDGFKHYKAYLDGKELSVSDYKLKLEPATHKLVIKYLSEGNEKTVPSVSLETETDGKLKIREDGKNLYTINDVLHGTRISSVQTSPSGNFIIVGYRTTVAGGKSSVINKVIRLSDGNIMASTTEDIRWMPRSDKYFFTRSGVGARELILADPVSGVENVLSANLPDGSFTVSPTEDYLIFTKVSEGPAERKEIYQILEPDDRQPGWRNRTSLLKFDLKTGVLQPLTFGYRNVYLTDISKDGKEILMMVSTRRLTQRPTTLNSLVKMNVTDMTTKVLVENDGFISNARFSPDGKSVLISGSPESLNGIGMNVKEGQIPSMIDTQLYMLSLNDGKITPLTKTFNPNVLQYMWNESDNMVYFTAENKDHIDMFSLNPSTGKISNLNLPEELITGFSVSGNNDVLSFYGESASNGQRLYTLHTNSRKAKPVLIDDISAKILEGIEIGKCEEWNFINSRGDTICGRYYLPPHFDENKKYPVIVNYYGGCSPTSRNFESRYPHHAYAALGYVVYVIQPSGATGFGQEFSARHVNTFGDYVADDIIEGTKKFVAEHKFTNPDKIGCIGASYGGFMTQYLQTKTDIFAAGISHAGISDITSYWGEGYWGYSYSEVSAAGSYPWNNPKLFTEHSPLFNADKIHTPLLFLHGDADVNVPVGESIQMFTALKLLGRETAFVAVTDQDHHIVDYDKRIKWQNTIFAWFAKWLQDDDTWWNAIYKPKSL